MNYNSSIYNSQNYKKVQINCNNTNHNCKCLCHNKIDSNEMNKHLLILEENNLKRKRDKYSKLNVIKTETNSNLIKSFVIYKNQIKPLHCSKIVKKSRKNVSSNIKKYSYGGNKLRVATITNNHSYKEILGRSLSKDKIFKKSRVINYNTDNNTENKEYNFDYSNNNINNQNNMFSIKNSRIRNQIMKKCQSNNDLYIKTSEKNNICSKEDKYVEFINDLDDKLNNNYENEKNSLKKETEININNKYILNNLINHSKNFKYYYNYKKNALAKKKNLLNIKSNMKINSSFPANRVNDDYEDIKSKIKLGLLKQNKEIKKNRIDIDYILLEKTKKILELKNKRNEKNFDNNNLSNKKNKVNSTLNELKNLIEKSNLNNKSVFKEKN